MEEEGNVRKLTLTRRKKFRASLCKYKVYVEDKASDDIVINGVTCRKLGELKNGDTQTYEIGEEAAKIFVIADKLSKDFCNDFYELPEGSEDVALCGQSSFSLGLGNPFRFDGNDGAAARAHRKKTLSVGIVALVAFVIVGAFVGFFIGKSLIASGSSSPKNFSCDDMTITLTKAFKESANEKFKTTYLSKNVGIYVSKEDVSLIPTASGITVAEYAELLIAANSDKENTAVETRGGLTYFEYDSFLSSLNETYHYVAFVYKTDNAFWMIQFATRAGEYKDHESAIFGWADTVRFSH